MKLWLLRPQEGNDKAWDPWFDKCFGFVVRAPDEQTARVMASEEGGGEKTDWYDNPERNNDPWLDPTQSTCEELSPAGPQDIIIRDFQCW